MVVIGLGQVQGGLARLVHGGLGGGAAGDQEGVGGEVALEAGEVEGGLATKVGAEGVAVVAQEEVDQGRVLLFYCIVEGGVTCTWLLVVETGTGIVIIQRIDHFSNLLIIAFFDHINHPLASFDLPLPPLIP